MLKLQGINTKRKISLLFIAAIVLYCSAFIVFNIIQRYQSKLLIAYKHELFEQSVKVALKTNETSIYNLAFDYTAWDDMVEFVATKDADWAENNIATILQVFKMNTIWTYNLKGELVFYINNTSPEKEKIIPIPEGVFRQLSERRFVRFYLSVPEGVFLIQGATIHHTTDLKRTQQPNGYFFVGKCIDESFLADMANLTVSTVELTDIRSDLLKIKEKPEVEYSYQLPDWTGKGIKELLFVRKFIYGDAFTKFSRIALALFIGISVFMLISFYLLFNRWVTRPLEKIRLGLTSGDIGGISQLKKKKDEFGQLAGLMEKFLLQKQELEIEIIEKKRTEHLLSESEDKFSKAFLFSPVAMIISTLDTQEYVSVNESFSQMTGFSPMEIQGQPIAASGIFTDASVLASNAAKLERGLEMDANETIIKTKTGDFRFGIINCDLIHLQGKKCLLTVVLDITERKQVEMAMHVARNKAEESDRLKYFLLMNMSHELRTPLTGIIGFTELIKDESQEKSIQLLAERILISGDRLLFTLNSIMLLAEIHSGSLSVSLQKCDVGKEIAKTTKEFAKPAKLKSLSLECHAGEQLYANIDPEQLRQITIRLLDNAIKFTEKGKVEVSVYKEIVEKQECVTIAVTDTGIGIESEKMHEIFFEFKQLSEGAGRSFEGCGLGLSISKQLTLLMSGEISVNSVVGSGTTVYVRFPLFSEPLN